MEKVEAIKRAFYLIEQIDKVKNSKEKVKSLTQVNGADWSKFENYDTMLTREDIGEANRLLVDFLTERINTREFNYSKELECIAIYKRI